MTLSDFLYEYRQQHGLSQRQMSVKCDVSNAYICYLENRTTRKGEKPVPSLPTLMKLAKGMGMSLEELISSVDELQVTYKDSVDTLPVGNHNKQKEFVKKWILEQALDFELVELIQLAAGRLKQK